MRWLVVGCLCLVDLVTHQAISCERVFRISGQLTLLPKAFYDFLSYGGGEDFYPTPQETMLKLFDWFEIWYT